MEKPHRFYSWAVQAAAPLRWAFGLLLIAAGLLGFLPVLGFWMVPLGVLLIASGSPRVRAFAKRMLRRSGAWLRRRSPRRGDGRDGR